MWQNQLALMQQYFSKHLITGQNIKMSQTRSTKIIFVFAALAAVAAGAWMGANSGSPEATGSPAKIQGAILPKAKTLHDFNVINQHKQAYTLADLKNKWSLIFVGYTHCPDVCPTALNTLKQVKQLMQEQSLIAPQIIFLSIDPERDTAEILSEYVNYFDQDFIGLTGTVEEIKNLSTQLSVTFAKSPGSSGEITEDDYLMDHSSSFMLINPDGKLQTFITAPHTTANIIYAVQKSQIYYQQQKPN